MLTKDVEMDIEGMVMGFIKERRIQRRTSTSRPRMWLGTLLLI
jgi:hypothetical protein